MGKLTSAEYRARQHPDNQALIDKLVVDPTDESTTESELLAAVAAVVGDEESGLVKDVADLETQVGDPDTKAGGLEKAVDGLQSVVGDGESGLVKDVATLRDNVDDLQDVAPVSGAPVTAQTAGVAVTGDGENYEITWTAQNLGTNGNGITIAIELSAQATGVDIVVVGKNISIAVEATGEPLSTIITATDVLTAVNAHETAGALVQGALTGSGDPIAADEQVTAGAVDITAAVAGAIRYESDKIWISIDESTASVSSWRSAALTDPNE